MRRGFTLVELLVVIAILAVLMGILLPGLALARRHAQSTVGNANMRSLTQVMLMYTQDNQDAFLDPFGKGCLSECDCTAADCTDAPLTLEPVHAWDFNTQEMPAFATEFFSYYWYSYLSLHDGQPAMREEQRSPADTAIRGLQDRYGDSPLHSGQVALWPTSFLYSPTFWCSADRYEPGEERACNLLNRMGKTQYHSSVSYPSSKVLLFERLDFGQRDRVRVERSEAVREGRSPAWNNLRATTAVSVVDGSVEEVSMADLYAAAAEDEGLAPVGVGRGLDEPPIVLSKEQSMGAVGGSNRSDGEYPLFFWATARGVEGRDLPR